MQINTFLMNDNSKNWPMAIGVYAIWSEIDDKKYVGIAWNPKGFKERWKSHRTMLRGNYHDNSYLQNHYNKYGENNLLFKILETCPKGIAREELEYKESQWIEKLQSLSTKNGWNFEIYDTHKRKRKQPNNKQHEKHFKLITPDGNLVEGVNISKFSKENNLEATSLSRVINGKYYSHRGYKSTHKNFENKAKIYSLISPSGKLYQFDNGRAFSKEHNLTNGNLYAVLNGQISHTKGWHLPEIPKHLINTYNQYTKEHKLLSPDNVLHIFTVGRQFINKYHFSSVSFYRLLQGKIPCLRGWTLYKGPPLKVIQEDF